MGDIKMRQRSTKWDDGVLSLSRTRNSQDLKEKKLEYSIEMKFEILIPVRLKPDRILCSANFFSTTQDINSA
ncbi:hypothetical protein TNIN_244741 [Trichonephila inaurata madagascariensis]|uniref:Uncharacterized protein n=1 Tax=Trichonephila inaurata madagascariensis TaxID=2747483 RepID=A0A8X6Y4W7_9ARAC|nr:hypothetical protein TNIN_244741 [Trichonephila inaurata madagascariensis]